MHASMDMCNSIRACEYDCVGVFMFACVSVCLVHTHTHTHETALNGYLCHDQLLVQENIQTFCLYSMCVHLIVYAFSFCL